MRIFIAALAILICLTAFASEVKPPAAEKRVPTSTSKPIQKSIVDSALAFLNPAQGWSVNNAQKVDFDQKLWSKEALSDGSEIYNFVGAKTDGEEHKRVILRDGENLSSVSSFRLSKEKGKTNLHEQSASVVFHKGELYAVTQCRDENDKAGRNCLTVTREVCSFVNQPSTELPKRISDQLKVLEVRALATILALRGADHQLENMAKHGNRLGLKNPLQTTKGKLTTKDQKLALKVRDEARAICQAAKLDSSNKAIAVVPEASSPKAQN